MTTRKRNVIHGFLKHYNKGKDIPFEEKPLDIIRYPSLMIYQIEYKKYSNSYSFFNSEKCVDFTSQVKNGLNVFIIENTQNSNSTDLQPLLNTRYWTTETYDSIYFNVVHIL